MKRLGYDIFTGLFCSPLAQVDRITDEEMQFEISRVLEFSAQDKALSH
jgi:hypothetical protein